ncbi:myosin light chain kinase 2, skeletal/cardiac muscle [Pezoporus flaviventris]|uniref:myosin light chain kinase 2, skeletal/cardiac muscle n=1 Tax=Pezoporus flaviventris TaxID=889875 RepID=UPI002AB236DD|nr:myosin light chain kinase 2, skeletal/cardiac muscle [Pezoporus flaviventris]
MEQGGGAGSEPGAGGTAPPEAEGTAAPAAPQAAQPQGGMETSATEVQDGGKGKPGQEKAPAAAVAQDGGKGEHRQEKAAGEAGGGKAGPAPPAPEPQDGKKAELAEGASAEQHDGGEAAPTEEKVLDAAKAQDGGKNEPGKEKAPAAVKPEGGQAPSIEEKAPAAGKAEDGGKDEPREEKAPAAGKPKGEQAEPTEGKGLAGAEAQDRGKDEPTKEQAPGGLEPEGGGKAEPMEEKVPAAAEAEEEKAKPTKEAALAAAQAQDGGKESAKEKPTSGAKEKAPAPVKAQDGGKAAAKAEKTPADKKPVKAPAPVKAQDGEKQVAKGEKASAAKTAQKSDKEEPAKEKATGPAKKAPDAAKAHDGEKAAAKAKETPAAKKPQDGSKEEPAKEKAPAPAEAPDGGEKAPKVEKPPAASKAEDGGKEEPAKEEATAPAKEEAPAAVKAQDGGAKAADVESPPAAAEAGDGGEEPAEAAAPGEGEQAAKAEETGKQQARGAEPPRPALLQSLSCPAACQRDEQPWAEGPAMEVILEETTVMEPAEPGPVPSAQGDLQPPQQPPGTPQERTLPSATGQAPAEQPGPAGQPSSTEAEPPPSPYLTPDFGKEDPFEILDDVPPPPAPFAHRIVTLRSASISSQFNLSSKEILGGGKFGEVHTCTEKQTGLKLAAKVIRKQGAKDKEMVLLEIDVMNQLNHRNLIQLYDAIETPREIILFMEFVEGGELFERIIDDDYQLTEVDCMVFVRQICEGIRFMHHMRVLHLDLKPENILCVAATGHMVKIIDFGLARRYNPQEKLKVNFGTPEFLSPEVVNYEQVSYTTDMWSMGVITYMLLSGLSPFLGDNDTETLNNVLAANWYFDEETFESVSNEAKDFVSNLIIKDKSARMSASQCLEHPWLNNLAEKAKRCNRRLKSQVLLKKYVMRRRWKKNFIGVCAANRFKKITSSGSLTALGI